MARGPLTPRLMPTMAMEAMVDMDSAMEATAMAVLATATARGLLIPRLMPTTAMEAMVDTGSATPLAMAVMARGLQTLRLMPTMAMEDMVDTVLVTPLATVLAMDTAVTERGPLILRPMPTTVMAE